MPTHHDIPDTPEHMVLGYLDAMTKPVLKVDSGDTVTLASWPAGGKATLLPDATRVPAGYRRALDEMPSGPGPHFLTGPVYVRDAVPGDTLQVDILAAKPTMDWGFVSILPLLGTLPEEFTDYETIHPSIDRARGVATLPWGTELPLDPFFGIIATAPPKAWGRCGSPVPRSFGGNMDNKELKPGTTLYLPVFNEGALFFAGDGHGVQGDGEVCINALETCLTGTFTLILHRRADGAESLKYPRAETPSHFISMGMDRDLDQAMKRALREMIAFICARSKLSREEAYQLCSLAVDFHVTQTVNGEQGVHGMLRRGLLF